MDSFELNKIIGGVLAAAFVVFTLALVSDGLFEAHPAKKPGYVLVAANAEHEKAEASKEASAEKADEGAFMAMLANADAAAGAKVFKKCKACHTVDDGGKNKVGPNLWGIVDRPIASHEGFGYSGAMKAFSDDGKVKWTYENLDGFLTSPRKFLKGTAMGFAGVRKEKDRANLIAFLREQATSPVPLPAK